MEIIEQHTEGLLKFVLSDNDKKVAKGREVIINKRYRFNTDGELIVSARDAAKMQRILCRFHGCKLMSVDQPDTVIHPGGELDKLLDHDSGSAPKISPASTPNKPTSGKNQPASAQT